MVYCCRSGVLINTLCKFSPAGCCLAVMLADRSICLRGVMWLVLIDLVRIREGTRCIRSSVVRKDVHAIQGYRAGVWPVNNQEQVQVLC